MAFDPLRDWLPYHPNRRVPITEVLYTPGENPVLVHASIAGTANEHSRVAIAADEGVQWIRGHHAEDSPGGKALLAAYALEHST